MSEIRKEYISVNGTRLSYETCGVSNGFPVVLLHGAFGSTQSMTPVRDVLSQNCLVISLDFRGHGDSEFSGNAFTVHDLADDVLELTKRLGFEKFDVVGFSLGAATAFCVAAKEPERVRKLVMISGCVAWDGILPIYRSANTAELDSGSEVSGSAPMDFQAAMIHLASLHYDWMYQAKYVDAQTLLISGSADIVDPLHMEDLQRNLLKVVGRNQPTMSACTPVSFELLDGQTHSSIVSSPALRDSVRRFFVPGETSPLNMNGKAVA